MNFSTNKQKIIFYNIPVILFSLLPLFLITGPFLSDLSISLISILFLSYCLREKNFSYFKNKYFYLFLIFWIYLILNSLLVNPNIDSLKISFFFFRYGVFVVAILSMLQIDDKFIKYFFYCILFCFICLILDGYYEYLTSSSIFSLSVGGSRISSLFGDEKILGSYLARLWPIFFGLSIIFFKKKDKIFFLLFFIFVFSEALIFLTGERTAFFFINLSAIFVILCSNKLFKLRLITLLSSLMLIVIISYINPNAKERVVDITLKQMNLIDREPQTEEIYAFSKQHTYHYITAYRMFLDNKILGVGVKNFRKFCDNEKYEVTYLSCATHPHNVYIQILTETGIIGFSFLIFIFFNFFKYTFKHLFLRFNGKHYFNDFEICILSGILIYIWPIAPSGNVFNNWLNIILILYIPLLVWSRKKAK